MHRALFEARKRWQGPPHINEVKPCEIVLYFKVSFCFYSTHSGIKIKGFINLVCLEKKNKTANEAFSLLINCSSPKLHSAPFKHLFLTLVLLKMQL